MIEQPDRDVDHILAAIRWPRDEVTYSQIMNIVTGLGSGVLVIDAPEEIFAEVAQAVRDAGSITPEHRHRYLFQISSRPRRLNTRPYVERLRELLGARGILRLTELLFQEGMTPAEAQPWLEPPDRNWPEAEHLLFAIYEQRAPDDEPLPFHIRRWIERYREKHAAETMTRPLKADEGHIPE